MVFWQRMEKRQKRNKNADKEQYETIRRKKRKKVEQNKVKDRRNIFITR